MSTQIESDPQGLVQEIRKILGTDQNLREEAEKNITRIAKEAPDSFIASLLDLLDGNYDVKDKKSACVWLQKGLSSFLQGLPDLYIMITP